MNGTSPTRVLFIHPAFPNQFTATAEKIAEDPAYECYGMVSQVAMPTVQASNPRIPYIGFQTDGAVPETAYPYTNPMEAALRNARGIIAALGAIRQSYRFDAIVGYAGFGATLHVRPIMECAVVSYSELPGYHSSAARAEFPFTLDQLMLSGVCESLNYASMLNADIGVVPSRHTRELFPPELHEKIRVQMEGFDVDHVPAGGPAERAALGLPTDGPLVGFFARTLEAVRGFDIFVRVARRLREMDPSIRFVAIGEERSIYGNEGLYLNGQSFKQWALAQAGFGEENFIWRTYMPYEQFRRHIACLDLAILPLFEGAANWNLFEAMAAELPIVASNRCFIPEVIRNGREGVLLDPYDIEGFVMQALALLRDRRRASALGAAAQARIREEYSVARAAEGYKAIIQEAIVRYNTATGLHGWKANPMNGAAHEPRAVAVA